MTAGCAHRHRCKSIQQDRSETGSNAFEGQGSCPAESPAPGRQTTPHAIIEAKRPACRMSRLCGSGGALWPGFPYRLVSVTGNWNG